MPRVPHPNVALCATLGWDSTKVGSEWLEVPKPKAAKPKADSEN